MNDIYEKYKSIFSTQLEHFLVNYRCNIQPVFDAVKYSVVDGGKRIRPILCYLSANFCDKTPNDVRNIALGIEMIHCYSLVHDDMPCMDNDMLRHGKPSTHAKFGEGMAMLAGDGLLNLAYETMLFETDYSPASIEAIRYVAQNAGLKGMVGGQCIDMRNCDKTNFDIDMLTELNLKKTSCLIMSATVGSAIKCGANTQEIADLSVFSEKLGLIFQIVDDILDATSTEEALGKNVNRDKELNKKTFVDILGVEKARAYVSNIEKTAISSLEKYGTRADGLISFCKYLTNRIN